ncbi:MAG: NYN domain-containing protein [bacterium]
MKQTLKYKDQRVGVFLDVQNIYHSAKSLYQKRANFKEILKTAVAGRKLIRAIAYGIRTESGEETAFFDALEHIGIEVKLKDLQIFPGGIKKADWDVGLAIDAVRLSSSMDAIVIVSGDGDYVPLIEYIKFTQGCRAEAIGFGESTSNKLKLVVDDFTDLSENLKEYLI